MQGGAAAGTPSVSVTNVGSGGSRGSAPGRDVAAGARPGSASAVVGGGGGGGSSGGGLSAGSTPYQVAERLASSPWTAWLLEGDQQGQQEEGLHPEPYPNADARTGFGQTLAGGQLLSQGVGAMGIPGTSAGWEAAGTLIAPGSEPQLPELEALDLPPPPPQGWLVAESAALTPPSARGSMAGQWLQVGSADGSVVGVGVGSGGGGGGGGSGGDGSGGGRGCQEAADWAVESRSSGRLQWPGQEAEQEQGQRRQPALKPLAWEVPVHGPGGKGDAPSSGGGRAGGGGGRGEASGHQQVRVPPGVRPEVVKFARAWVGDFGHLSEPRCVICRGRVP